MRNRAAATLIVVALLPAAAGAADATTKTLVEKTTGVAIDKSIEGLLVDTAAGSVSASSLAGVEGDALSVVENVRDVSLLVNALDPAAKGFGLSITPARTTLPVPSINLHAYRDSLPLRLLGALTLGYAQGSTDFNGTAFTRRALSIGTSAFLSADDDPVVAVAKASQCGREAVTQLTDDRPTITAVEQNRLIALARLAQRALAGDAAALTEIQALRKRAAQGDATASAELEVVQDSIDQRLAADGDAAARAAQARKIRNATRLPAEQEKAALDAFNACADAVLKEQALKWNRSRYAVSFATGSVKPTDGSGSSVNLGRTLALQLLYGFDGVPGLKDNAAISLMLRRSRSEPVLDTLGSAAVQTKDSNLVAIRLAGGSSVFRALLEANNAKDGDVTSTQRTFRRAVGIDLRVMNGLWLNLRYGQQRKIDGSGDETGSFVVLNYSPSALLGH